MSAARPRSASDDREPTLADIADLVGEDAARTLAEMFGGRRLYLRRDPGQHHPLTAAVGLKAALTIGQVLGGLYIDVPLSPGRRASILKLADEGKGPIEIQRMLRCSRRLVFKVLAEARNAKASDQGDLF